MISGVTNARFIPTCVGNIAEPPEEIPSIPVHPHVCGEHSGSFMLG